MNHKQTKDLLKYIVQKEFFPKYCPGVKCYIFKSRGRDARGLPQEFSEEEIQQILAGIERMASDLKKKFSTKLKATPQTVKQLKAPTGKNPSPAKIQKSALN